MFAAEGCPEDPAGVILPGSNSNPDRPRPDPTMEPDPTRRPRALVTGASSGLGREIVRQLVLNRGMDVLATARRVDRLDALASELPAGRFAFLPGDLADPAFRDRLWIWAVEAPGGIDVLVNNAGAGHFGALAVEDFEQARRMVELNLIALIDLTRKAIRHMQPRGSGQIVQISSILGAFGLPYSAVYAATKHGVDGLVKSLRYELRGSGVRVWAARPGRTESEFFESAAGGQVAPGGMVRGRSTARVARAIVRGLDGQGAFLAPTLDAWATLAASRWMPRAFDAFMARWSPGYFRAELERARGRPAGEGEGDDLSGPGRPSLP